MKISLIAAVADNGVIGRDGDLPWHLPDDFRFFKEKTLGHHLVMGRRTLESIGGPLPGRTIIVLTRHPSEVPQGVEVASSLENAIEAAQAAGESELFIGGGAEVYHRALPHADRIYLTRVHATPLGDTFFPHVDEDRWEVVSSERRAADERHAYEMTFQVLEPAER